MTLYILFFALTLVALSVLVIPFRGENKILLSKNFLSMTLLYVLLAFGLYQILGQPREVQTWLTEGKEHYHLQEMVAELGGIEGMIAKIKMKLQQHPEDAQGWIILGKLYSVYCSRAATVRERPADCSESRLLQ